MMNETPRPNNLLKLKNFPMPYGKYKGLKLIDLPEPYVVWLYENNLPTGELGALLSELYEIKVNGLESLIRDL